MLGLEALWDGYRLRPGDTFLRRTVLFFCRTQNVLGEKGRRIRELTAVVQKRFGFPEGSVEVKVSWLKQ